VAFIRIFSRYSDPAPALEGRTWEEARAEFQSWAEKVVSILDSLSNVEVDASIVIVPPGGGGGAAPPPIMIAPDPSELGFTSRRPAPHTHPPGEVVGLPSDTPSVLAGQVFARRDPLRVDEVRGLLGNVHVILAGQVFGP
jgi:hypothetical protein